MNLHVNHRRKWLTLIILAAAAVFMFLNVFVLPCVPRFVPEDQFIFFDDARRMLAGQSLYVDFFQYTLPATEFLYFGLLKLIGFKLWLPDVIVIVLAVASVWCGYIIAEEVLSPIEATLPCVLFLCLGWYHTPDATHHKFSVLLVYGATAILIRRRDPSRLIAAGVLCALATLFTQTRALVVVALAAFVAWETLRRGDRRGWLRREAYLLIPFIVVLVPPCAYLVWELGTRRFISLTIGFPLFHYREDPIHNAWSALAGDFLNLKLDSIVYSVLMHALIPAVYVWFLIYYQRSRMQSDSWEKPILVATVGITLFITVSYAPLWVRLCEISLPAFILLIWMIEQMRHSEWMTKPLWAFAILLLFGMPAYLQVRWRGYLDTPGGRAVMFDRKGYEEFRWMLQHIRPGEYVFWPSSCAAYCLLDVPNPASIPFLTPNGYTLPEQVLATVAELERHTPRLIFWTSDLNDREQPGDPLEPLRGYLSEHYKVVRTFPDGDQVWQRFGVTTARAGVAEANP